MVDGGSTGMVGGNMGMVADMVVDSAVADVVWEVAKVRLFFVLPELLRRR
jgi:hypothetical protein